jgi:hypothetical protein
MMVANLGGEAKVSLTPKAVKKDLTFDQWSQAWNVFQAVFCSHHPDTSSKLAKHYQLVRDLHHKKTGVEVLRLKLPTPGG